MNPATTAREQRIEEILRASIPVFAARGYHKTSMANIADAADVSRPALYQYFTDRADLFGAAFRLLLEESADAAINAMKRAHGGLRARLALTPADRPTRTGAFELLTLSTAGLKQDHPTPTTYRRRLTFLAQVTARTLLWPHDSDPAHEAPVTGPRRDHPPA